MARFIRSFDNAIILLVFLGVSILPVLFLELRGEAKIEWIDPPEVGDANYEKKAQILSILTKMFNAHEEWLSGRKATGRLDFDRDILEADPNSPIPIGKDIKANGPLAGGTYQFERYLSLEGLSIGDFNLSSSRWHGVSFKNAELRDIDLSNTTLSDVQFTRASLTDTHFEDSDLFGVGFSHATLTDVSFPRAALTNTGFDFAKLTKVSFTGNFFVKEGKGMSNVWFSSASLADVNFDGAQVFSFDFSWADLTGVDFGFANLNSGVFRGTNLINVMFIGTTLREVDFIESHMSDVDFSRFNEMGYDMFTDRNIDLNTNNEGLYDLEFRDVHLEDVSFWGTRLVNVQFRNVDHINVDFESCFQTNVQFRGGKLSPAQFGNSTLSGVELSSLEIASGDFSNARFSGNNCFESFLTAEPLLDSLSSAHGLATFGFSNSEAALISLRSGFTKLGMREQEREINYAVNHQRRLNLGRGESLDDFWEWVWYSIVEVLTGYGMTSGKPLKIMGWMTLFMGFIYAPVVFQSVRPIGGQWGIWLHRSEDSSDEINTFDPDKPTPIPGRFWPRKSTEGIGFKNFFYGMFHAFYFSLMMTFHIGWKNLSIGNWISRLDPRGVVLKSTGWVRTVSGIQSIVGMVLVAFWLWSYFSLPLE